jgi:deazaflavin-dependent oxidoreductase (nitroreductase family)
MPTEPPEKLPPRWVLKLVSRTHTLLNRITAGRAFNTLGGDEVCFVTMTGAKSGRRITMPLMYVPHGQGVLLVASQGGAPKNPFWYNNIARNPDIAVRYRGKDMKLRARLATPEEKPSLWPVCDAAYAPFVDYRARTSRDIPIFVCEPRG